MRKTLLTALIAWLAPLASPAGGTELTGPDVAPSEGASLAWLARTAMDVYVRVRTPADQQPIPQELTRLEKRPHAACVTLRRQGKVLAQIVRTGNSLPRNVIAASLAAMRSPLLGDVVTQDVLNGLVVEVEVLGPARLVGQEKVGEEADLDERQALDAALAKLLQPGRVGLKLIRGPASSYALPSVAYERGLGLAGMRRCCLESLPLGRESVAQMPQWSVFLSEQYVSFPAGRVVRLYRGKILLPPEAVDEAVLTCSAERIARYLADSQGPDGRLMPKDQPTLLDHLYATWALARLPATRADKKLSACLNAALGYSARLVRPKGPAGAYVDSEQPEDQLAATALLVLALRAAGENASLPGQAWREKLTGMIGQAGGAGSWQARLDGASGEPASPWAVCLARMAAAGSKDSPPPGRLPGFAERTEALSGQEMLWALRAGIPISTSGGGLRKHFQEALAASGFAFASLTDPPDQRGGLARAGQPPRTELTALAAVVLKGALAQTDVDSARSGEWAVLASWRLEARRFCSRMVYRPLEAYFAEHPEDWEAAVRAGPESARISLRAAATAMEAMME